MTPPLPALRSGTPEPRLWGPAGVQSLRGPLGPVSGLLLMGCCFVEYVGDGEEKVSQMLGESGASFRLL